MAKKVSLRQCVGCGEMKDKKEMMRVLKSAEGLVSLDMTGRKNGRGAYLCKRGECLWKARKNKGFGNERMGFRARPASGTILYLSQQ